MIETIYAAVRYVDLNIIKCSFLDLIKLLKRSWRENDS